jgi:hypothetical protein
MCEKTWIMPSRHTVPPVGGGRDAVGRGHLSVVAGGVYAADLATVNYGGKEAGTL